MNRTKWTYEMSAVLVLFVMLMMATHVSAAQPTADSFGVTNASGAPGTYVTVPVNSTNTSNGPILGIVFNIAYDRNVINVIDVSQGDLTTNLTVLNSNFDGGTRILLVGPTVYAIPNGSSGSVVLLNFSVIGGPPYETKMNLSTIELSDISGYNIGPAPARNGTFYVTGLSPVPVPEYTIPGLIAVIAASGIVFAVTIRRRRRR
jgi:hypothetical protein